MKTTLLQQRTVTIEHLRSQVNELLKWSDADYGEFVFETGISYLAAYFSNDQAVINYVSQRREFWNWFKTLWASRDEAFVETELIDCIALSMRLEIYQDLHNPIVLANERYPGRQVLGADFHTIKMQVPC